MGLGEIGQYLSEEFLLIGKVTNANSFFAINIPLFHHSILSSAGKKSNP